MVDTLKKTIVSTMVTVQTPAGRIKVEVFGKVQTLTVRQIVRATIRARCADDDNALDEYKEIIAGNFLVLDYVTHSTMYECNVYDFMKIAKEYKIIN